MKLIEIINLTKEFDNFTALDRLTMDVNAGELTIVFGAGGSGKSTLISLLTGIQTASSGTINYPAENKPSFGVVFQHSVLNDELTVWQNLKSRADLFPDIQQQEIPDLMNKVGVSQYADKKYGDLSHVIQRKVDIARALINQPDLLFLDDPMTDLDTNSIQEIWNLLKALQSSDNLTIFMTSQCFDEAESADNIIILSEGVIIEQGSGESLKEKYGQNYLWLSPNDEKSIVKKIKSKKIKKDSFKGVGIPINDFQEAIDTLNTYKNDITNFMFHPITFKDIYYNIVKRDN